MDDVLTYLKRLEHRVKRIHSEADLEKLLPGSVVERKNFGYIVFDHWEGDKDVLVLYEQGVFSETVILKKFNADGITILHDGRLSFVSEDERTELKPEDGQEYIRRQMDLEYLGMWRND